MPLPHGILNGRGIFLITLCLLRFW